MRLKRIKLAGFKSFVDPTSIPFPDDMTAIVGPNGCGKSNVIDAVRWVLGESSAKNLRGDAMTDVIFNGSSARKPVSQSSVELVFDNSMGRIQGEFANYNELSVKRVVTRDAQSLYYLNSSKCRRRDITDLFLGTGLGPRSYAIIEQGMISRLIESKPQELRVFIEEAAGISKYKERRKETENRMRHTRENLERLEDVRVELGQQLEKLQRQATAAKRYKELKARERKLKAELAALRWLQQSEKINQLEAVMATQQTELESFVAQQRGDEKGIIELKTQGEQVKSQLDDVQQGYFKLGTDITRLEQTQLHAKQRQFQIEQETAELSTSLQLAVDKVGAEIERIEQLSLQLAEDEPAMEQAQASLIAAEEAVHNFEVTWQQAMDDWRRQEQQHSDTKQQLSLNQNQQSALQTLISRGQERQQQLSSELASMDASQLQADIDVCSDQHQQLKQQRDEQEALVEQGKLRWGEWQQSLNTAQQVRNELQGQVQNLKAQLSGLEARQQTSQSTQTLRAELSAQNIDGVSLVDWLEVEPGWEIAVQTLISGWQNALVLEGSMEQLTNADSVCIDGAKVWFTNAMATQKESGSIAEKVKNPQVPGWFNRVKVAEQSLPAGIQGQDSWITSAGQWAGADWLIDGNVDDELGDMQIKAQKGQLAAEIERLSAELDRQQDAVEALTPKGQELESNRETAIDKARQLQRQLGDIDGQRQVLTSRLDDIQLRTARLEEEQQGLTAQLEQEQENRLTLEAQAEQLHQQLLHSEEQHTHVQQAQQEAHRQLQEAKAQFTQRQSASHQIAVRLEGLKHQVEGARQSQAAQSEQIAQMQQRKEHLVEERLELESPMQENAEQLEILLAQRVETEQQKNRLNDQWQQLQNRLLELEKGQQGIQQQVAQRQEQIQSTRLEIEGHKVRSSGFIEQLQEMQLGVKSVLDSMDDGADEKAWSADLEKVQNSVARLGAVNLAAVDEYEQQSQRKSHLDSQHDDLIQALETLESAIRKIDRETRSRFKTTFDQVNGDLQHLFPKVFDGGSAYLELTDDDLLDTGVTIMARPPGKKNSTIHLLSGGEKALTALSLVFAIFRLNPAPFCLLDEVDAPLDDANVGRFCRLVSEMSETVQFIYITHNKIAMEMATHLTGVTMAEPGVSRMVAVDVDEAVAFAQA